VKYEQIIAGFRALQASDFDDTTCGCGRRSNGIMNVDARGRGGWGVWTIGAFCVVLLSVFAIAGYRCYRRGAFRTGGLVHAVDVG